MILGLQDVAQARNPITVNPRTLCSRYPRMQKPTSCKPHPESQHTESPHIEIPTVIQKAKPSLKLESCTALALPSSRAT